MFGCLSKNAHSVLVPVQHSLCSSQFTFLYSNDDESLIQRLQILH